MIETLVALVLVLIILRLTAPGIGLMLGAIYFAWLTRKNRRLGL